MAKLGNFGKDLKGKSFAEMSGLFWLNTNPDIEAIIGRLDLLCFEIPERYPRIFIEEIECLRGFIQDARKGDLKIAMIRRLLESMEMKAERYMKEKR